MQITIVLNIPEESVYAGVVADALEKIAPYWDDGARRGDLVVGPGPDPLYISWDSSVIDPEEDEEADPELTEFQVEVQRTITTTVPVMAEDAEAAVRIVDHVDFELPGQHDWNTLDGYLYLVDDQDGDRLYEGDAQ